MVYMEKRNKTKELVFNIEQPLIFNWTGKFEAPYASWSHLTRTLYDYELMFVTRGTLYIMADNEQYKISKGEYIIMPPFVQQHGWKPSDCAFYWLHFSQNEGEPVFIIMKNVPLKNTAHVLMASTGQDTCSCQ